jgi:D-glycero-D-manno-heptose 1,7-bisphosphate phosphatase
MSFDVNEDFDPYKGVTLLDIERAVNSVYDINTENSMNVLFFNIAGTITETHSGDTFKRNADDVKLIDGARESIKRYSDEGWAIIGISNQGGCSAINKTTGRLFKTIPDVVAEMQRTIELVPEIDIIYFCPDFKGDLIVCVEQRSYKVDDVSESGEREEGRYYPSFRKPKPGMIKYALDCLVDDATEEGLSIDVDECWMVGNRPEDEQCAINANINFCPAHLFRLASSKLPDDVKLTDKQLQFLVF